jgi:hypothetical protein
MKTLVTLLLFFFLALKLHAQAPQQFSFQGVARDAGGNVISNTTIRLRLTIHQNAGAGATVYQEVHNPLTSSGGVFSVFVGMGNMQTAIFSNIDWKASAYFIEVEIDPTGGANYINVGTTQLVSVPYALHSADAAEAARWHNNTPIIQTGKSYANSLPDIKQGPTLIWHPSKGAFRAGVATEDGWDDVNIGHSSFSLGQENTASGNSSMALGAFSTATGEYSNAIGLQAHATGIFSTAIGFSVKSIGHYSMSFGHGLTSKATFGVVLGRNNDDQDDPGKDSDPLEPLDRIFQLGNGTSSKNLNAVTILRNGNFGIGSNVLNPSFILDIGARPRVRHNIDSPTGATAGIYLDDSKGTPEGFVGMKTDNEIGLYNANKWLFWMDDSGNAHIIGNNYNTSDRRLKRDFSSLSNSLTKLSDLNGYHYFWKDSTMDQTLQTGLVAQEVEAMFPELVKTDDKGFKSVNYTGLIPHLIEAVKELKASVDYLQTLNASIKSQNEELRAQAGELDTFRKELDALRSVVKLPTEVETSSVNIENKSSSLKPSHK